MVYEIDKLLDEDKANHTIVMGDSNAKVGQQKDDSERMMGKFGTGTRNNRRDRLLEFALNNGFMYGCFDGLLFLAEVCVESHTILR